MKKITLELTDEEASYLASEMIRQFGPIPYAGKQFTNPDMASAFNKVFKALSGRDHENCSPSRLKTMADFHKKGAENLKS